MFGYVLINKPELKIREFEVYQSYYCGLCHCLQERSGVFGRMTLNYDITFLTMLLSDLYEPETESKYSRCIVHPIHKHCSRKNEVTEYCADMCILLSYYKCIDDWKDEKKLLRRLQARLLSRKYRQVRKKYPQKAEFIDSKLNMLSIVESSNITHIDKAARVFGEIMGEIFAYKDDMWRDDLYKIGFYLGKFVYLLDAYEDIEKDIKSGAYNPFKEIYGNSNFEEQVLKLLLLMIGECTDAFERLPLVDNVEILRNILYSGVWVRFGKTKAANTSQNREPNEKTDEGEIDGSI